MLLCSDKPARLASKTLRLVCGLDGIIQAKLKTPELSGCGDPKCQLSESAGEIQRAERSK
jgi:hypothetical protein